MMMRLGLAFVFVLLGTPTCCNAARELRVRGPSDPGSFSGSEERQELRSSNWNDGEPGDDAVPTSLSPSSAAANFNKWIRFLEEHETADYADTPAAANPSIPCC